MRDQVFFVTTMPDSRPANYHLGYMDGCIFFDFDNVESDKICLKRISFDGYGCCTLTEGAIPLDKEDSRIFKDIVNDEIKDQITLRTIVTKTIKENKNLIWTDALEYYNLT
jgi:hypothetical protein